MASEFEQVKRDVSGHSVMITSWFDAKKDGWRASAPNYNNIENLSPVVQRELCRSRQAAIDQVVHLLVRHFAQKPVLEEDSLIFL